MRRGLLFGFAALVPLAGMALLPALESLRNSQLPRRKMLPRKIATLRRGTKVSRRRARFPDQRTRIFRRVNRMSRRKTEMLSLATVLPVRTPGKKIVGRRASHGRPKDSPVSATRIAAIQLVRRLGASAAPIAIWESRSAASRTADWRSTT